MEQLSLFAVNPYAAALALGFFAFWLVVIIGAWLIDLAKAGKR